MSIELWKKRPPGYELFFAPLQVMLNPRDLENVEFAYQASKHGHEGQLRDDGTRYFDHPKATAWIYIKELGGKDTRIIIDALLHDISEDSKLLSPYRIALNLGEDIALDVGAMTKLPKGKEDTRTYLGRIIDRGPHAITTKLLDRANNNRSLYGCTPEKRQKQIEETDTFHRPILVPALRLYGGEWRMHADALDAKMQEALDMYR
jgi:(p)ppGpp synthase/HD superfamily hydrolase